MDQEESLSLIEENELLLIENTKLLMDIEELKTEVNILVSFLSVELLVFFQILEISIEFV